MPIMSQCAQFSLWNKIGLQQICRGQEIPTQQASDNICIYTISLTGHELQRVKSSLSPKEVERRRQDRAHSIPTSPSLLSFDQHSYLLAINRYLIGELAVQRPIMRRLSDTYTSGVEWSSLHRPSQTASTCLIWTSSRLVQYR